MKKLCVLVAALFIVAGCGRNETTSVTGESDEIRGFANVLESADIPVTGTIAHISLYTYHMFPGIRNQVIRLVNATVGGLAVDQVLVAICSDVRCDENRVVLEPNVLINGNMVAIAARGLTDGAHPNVKHLARAVKFTKANPASNLKLAVSFPHLPYFADYEIRVSWRDNSFNETSFRIERQVEQEPFELLAIVPPNTKEIIDRNTGRLYGLPALPASPKYTYRVTAVSAQGASLPVMASIRIPVLAQPEAASDLTLTRIGNSAIRANWKDNSDKETSYRVVYFDNNDLSGREYSIPLEKNSTTVLITGLKPGRDYYVKVYAIIAGARASNVVLDHLVLPIRP